MMSLYNDRQHFNTGAGGYFFNPHNETLDEIGKELLLLMLCPF